MAKCQNCCSNGGVLYALRKFLQTIKKKTKQNLYVNLEIQSFKNINQILKTKHKKTNRRCNRQMISQSLNLEKKEGFDSKRIFKIVSKNILKKIKKKFNC